MEVNGQLHASATLPPGKDLAQISSHKIFLYLLSSKAITHLLQLLQLLWSFHAAPHVCLRSLCLYAVILLMQFICIVQFVY